MFHYSNMYEKGLSTVPSFNLRKKSTKTIMAYFAILCTALKIPETILYLCVTLAEVFLSFTIKS